MAPATTDRESMTPHQILKEGESEPRPYRVTIGASGPAEITVDRLRAGGSHSFNRNSDDERDHMALLRLTAAEVTSLRQARFTIEPVDESELSSDDPFAAFDEAANSPATSDNASPQPDPANWDLVTTPSAYIEKTPDGPKADLARALIAAGHGSVSTKSHPDR